MLHKFFLAQWNHPAPRGEWTEQTKLDLQEFDISEDLEFIKSKSEFVFKKMVKQKAMELTLDLNKREGEMKNLFYADLEMQQYMKDKTINTHQAKAAFKFRTRMENFSDNFEGGEPTKKCPLFNDGDHLDTQRHSLVCKVIKGNIQTDINYDIIFYSNIGVEIAKTLENILKFREEYFNK